MRRLLALWTLIITWPGAGLAQETIAALAVGTHVTYPLTMKQGTFVQGRFSGRGLTLSLVDSDGTAIRQLAPGRRDDEDFMMVTPAPFPALRVDATQQAGTFTLSLAPPEHPRPTTPPIAQHADSPRLRAIQAQGDSRDFWAEAARRGGPLVETAQDDPILPADMARLTFLWRDRGNGNVWLFSAPSGNHDPMRKLAGTDIWFASYVVPLATRMTYKIAPDVPDLDWPKREKRRLILARAQRDPLNPRAFPETTADIFDGESVVELPDAPPQFWVGRHREIPAGNIQRLRLDSTLLGNQRDMLLYRPPGYVADAPGNALLVLFDAEFYQDRADIAAVLDNLHHAQAIPPTAALMIANPGNETRAQELPPNPDFIRFLDEEAMPWARSHGIGAVPAKTVVAGSSYGGLAAAHAGLRLPHWFGNVHSQSGSFWWAPPGEKAQWMARFVSALPRRDVRFHIEAGLFESGAKSILETSRQLRDLLRAKGYDVTYAEYASGHDLMRWRSTIATGLITLLGDWTIEP
ncbi:MAG: enterochelin esterase domain-containing protein [Magnetospirillum sp.]